MTTPVTVYRPNLSEIAVGGQPVIVMFGPVVGGFITNPSTATDQGLDEVEDLYVSVIGPPDLYSSPTTFVLAPGQSFTVPADQTTNVWANAASSGHKFSAIIYQQQTPYPPTPTPGPFPPTEPTSVTRTIPSYLYQQYVDDPDLRAFVAAYNKLTQEYVTWFNEVGLPVYTGDPIAGELLDWVAAGLYGMIRPSLASGRSRDVGPFNTFLFNQFPFNYQEIIGPTDVTVTTDDVFKRIITWHFYKGDGRDFSIRWLKRRIMRFLLGTNGISFNVDQTYQVSVSFGLDNQVNITLVTGFRRVTGGSLFNRFLLNGAAFNELRSDFESVAPLPNAKILKEAIDSGVLELPFQFEYIVRV